MRPRCRRGGLLALQVQDAILESFQVVLANEDLPSSDGRWCVRVEVVATLEAVLDAWRALRMDAVTLKSVLTLRKMQGRQGAPDG